MHISHEHASRQSVCPGGSVWRSPGHVALKLCHRLVRQAHIASSRTTGLHGREIWAIPDAALATAGDCDDDGAVTVAELVRAVGIALASAPLNACPAADANADGTVAIDELIAAVTAAL